MAVIGFFGRHYLNNFWRHANVLQCWDMRWYIARMFVWFPERSQGSSLLSCYCWYCFLYYIGFVIWAKGQKINLEFEANTHNPRAWNNIMSIKYGDLWIFFSKYEPAMSYKWGICNDKNNHAINSYLSVHLKNYTIQIFLFFVNCLFLFFDVILMSCWNLEWYMYVPINIEIIMKIWGENILTFNANYQP